MREGLQGYLVTFSEGDLGLALSELASRVSLVEYDDRFEGELWLTFINTPPEHVTTIRFFPDDETTNALETEGAILIAHYKNLDSIDSMRDNEPSYEYIVPLKQIGRGKPKKRKTQSSSSIWDWLLDAVPGLSPA